MQLHNIQAYCKKETKKKHFSVVKVEQNKNVYYIFDGKKQLELQKKC